jgi:hypothetical protein
MTPAKYIDLAEDVRTFPVIFLFLLLAQRPVVG